MTEFEQCVVCGFPAEDEGRYCESCKKVILAVLDIGDYPPEVFNEDEEGTDDMDSMP